MKKKHLVVLTGAGVSAESGIRTFRDADGLWEEYPVQEVASIEAWHRNPELMQEFYNARRKQLVKAEPNAAHYALAEAEKYFEVDIITQNIDNLHERAGSTRVLHLHGELMKCCSSRDTSLVYEMEGCELKMGQLAEDGSQLRPFIVWFGESVPNMVPACELVQRADFFAVVGSSLAVYPAASLVHYAPSGIPLYVVDPKPVSVPGGFQVEFIEQKASEGVPFMIERMRAKLQEGA